MDLLQADSGLPSQPPLGTSELLEAAERLQDLLRGFPLSLNLLLGRLLLRDRSRQLRSRCMRLVSQHRRRRRRNPAATLRRVRPLM